MICFYQIKIISSLLYMKHDSAIIYLHQNMGHRITNKNKINSKTFILFKRFIFSSNKIRMKLQNICIEEKSFRKIKLTQYVELCITFFKL